MPYKHCLIVLTIFFLFVTVYCNFDSGSRCDFTQDTQDDFDWTVHQGDTPSGGTGPSSDMSGKGIKNYHSSFLIV